MALNMDSLLGLQTRFLVEVDGIDLGGWGRCSGLTVDFKTILNEEGGNYQYQPIMADKVSYTPVKLARAMKADDSARVQQWLSLKASTWMNAPNSGGGGTAAITLCDAQGEPVTTWRLRNVFPAKWDGPSLDAMSMGIAYETLDLIHEGFL
jgi:phage tail-like protein